MIFVRLLLTPHSYHFIMGVPVTVVWRVFVLRIEDTASRFGRQLRIY
jgi:hypothetical protein